MNSNKVKFWTLTNLTIATFALGVLFVPIAKAQALTPEEIQTIRTETLKQIDKTKWSLQLTKMGSPDDKHEDTLTIEGGRLSSEFLTDLGFSPSNFSLTVEDSGNVMVETMQRTENDQVAFWRGQVKDNSFWGVMSRQNTKGETEAYSFRGEVVGEAVIDAPPAAVPELVIEEEAPAIEEEVVEDAVDEISEEYSDEYPEEEYVEEEDDDEEDQE